MRSNMGPSASGHLGHSTRARQQPIAVSIRAACEIAGIGRTTAYKLIREGKLQSATVGRRRVVIVASIMRLLLGRPT